LGSLFQIAKNSNPPITNSLNARILLLEAFINIPGAKTTNLRLQKLGSFATMALFKSFLGS
jgi:hypothetical protein